MKNYYRLHKLIGNFILFSKKKKRNSKHLLINFLVYHFFLYINFLKKKK